MFGEYYSLFRNRPLRGATLPAVNHDARLLERSNAAARALGIADLGVLAFHKNQNSAQPAGWTCVLVLFVLVVKATLNIYAN